MKNNRENRIRWGKFCRWAGIWIRLSLFTLLILTEPLVVEAAGQRVTLRLENVSLKEAFKEKGYRFLVDSPTNQQFLFLPREAKDKLSKDYAFECEGDVGQEEFLVRFCTSWATPKESVDKLLDSIKSR